MMDEWKVEEFREGVLALEEDHFAFIEDELHIGRDEMKDFDDEEFNDRIYEPMCEIEIEEVPDDDDEPESERCIMASDIVTVLGNSLAKANGWLEENE